MLEASGEDLTEAEKAEALRELQIMEDEALAKSNFFLRTKNSVNLQK